MVIDVKIRFDSRDTFYKNKFGAIRQGEEVTLSVRVSEGDWFNKITAIFHFDKNGKILRIPMCSHNSSGILSCEFNSHDYYGLVWYYFEIEEKDSKIAYFGRNTDNNNLDRNIPSKFQLTIYNKTRAPNWYAKGATYHVFVDRFNRGPNSPRLVSNADYFVHQNLGDVPHIKPNGHGDGVNSDIYGGNLRGIIEKLDYISSLGVTTIYLSPIFEAWSNHKYNTANYMKVDPYFGEEADLKALCETALTFGIRVILDGVFSHSGSDSVYFNAKGRYEELGASQSVDSKYRSWYTFNANGSYSSWWGIHTLPEVNKFENSFVNFIIDSKDSVINHWMKVGISGFRLDVADELPSEFLKRLYDKVKSNNNEAIVIGEVWEDASYKIAYGHRRHYLTEPELDGVMNYPLRDAIIGFLRYEISSKDFVERLNSILENYPEPALCSLMNIISSHDTTRIITMLSASNHLGESKEFKANYTLPDDLYEKGIALVKLAVTLQYMFPGSPTIYYGDEIGMQGFEDPLCRGYFIWDKQSKLTEFYKKMGRLKRSSTALHHGETKVFEVDVDVVCLKRASKSNKVIALVNRSSSEKRINLELDREYLDFLSGGSSVYKLGFQEIHLEPLSGLILCNGP